MATVNGYTAEHMQDIVDGTINDARLDGTDLILIANDLSEINVGDIQGPTGPTGDVSTSDLTTATDLLLPLDGSRVMTGEMEAVGIVSSKRLWMRQQSGDPASPDLDTVVDNAEDLGVLLTSDQMNTTNQFTPGLLFGSTDSAFTTTSPKVLAGIVGEAKQTFSSDSSSAMGMVFFTNPPTAGGTPVPTQRLSIDHNGMVEVGEGGADTGGSTHLLLVGDATSSSRNIGCSGDSTATRYHLTFINPNGVVGTISTNGSTTSYNTTSDARLKSRIGDIVEPLSIIEAIDVHQFQWIGSGEVDNGVFAQELSELVPEAVTEGGEDPETDPWTVDYSKLVPYLIGAVQELTTKVEALEAQLNQ